MNKNELIRAIFQTENILIHNQNYLGYLKLGQNYDMIPYVDLDEINYKYDSMSELYLLSSLNSLLGKTQMLQIEISKHTPPTVKSDLETTFKFNVPLSQEAKDELASKFR